METKMRDNRTHILDLFEKINKIMICTYVRETIVPVLYCTVQGRSRFCTTAVLDTGSFREITDCHHSNQSSVSVPNET